MNARAPEPPRHAQGAFVLSTGRCGSTLLSQLLRDHPAVLSLSEFFSTLGGARVFALGELSGAELLTFLLTPQLELEAALCSGPIPELLAEPDLHGAARGRVLSRFAPPLLTTLPHLSTRPQALLALIEGSLSAAPVRPVRAHLSELFALLARALERPSWVERSGGSAEYGHILLREWPEARAVFLVRDGLACVRSMARHPLFRLRVGHLLQGAHADAARILQAEIPLDRFAAYWSATMLNALKTFEACRGRALVICYERLLADPQRELTRMAAFLELPARENASWLARSRAKIERRARGHEHEVELAALQGLRPGLRCLEKLRRHAC